MNIFVEKKNWSLSKNNFYKIFLFTCLFRSFVIRNGTFVLPIDGIKMSRIGCRTSVWVVLRLLSMVPVVREARAGEPMVPRLALLQPKLLASEAKPPPTPAEDWSPTQADDQSQYNTDDHHSKYLPSHLDISIRNK